MESSAYTPEKPEAVQRAISRWVSENNQKIPGIVHLGYGWEPWVQADLGYYLALETGAHDTILRREVLAYPDLRRADLAIYGGNGRAWHYFEMKCQSPNETRNTFTQGLQADWNKLKDIWVDKHHARLWALGIWVDDGQGKPPGFPNWDFKNVNGINVLYRTWYDPKFSKL